MLTKMVFVANVCTSGPLCGRLQTLHRPSLSKNDFVMFDYHLNVAMRRKGIFAFVYLLVENWSSSFLSVL